MGGGGGAEGGKGLHFLKQALFGPYSGHSGPLITPPPPTPRRVPMTQPNGMPKASFTQRRSSASCRTSRCRGLISSVGDD